LLVSPLTCAAKALDKNRRKTRKGNGSDGGEAADWGTPLANIQAGVNLHFSIRDFAIQAIRAGMNSGAVINLLRQAMEKCTAPHDERWKERYDDIPRAVESAEETIAPKKPELPSTTLAEVHKVARKWLGEEYDVDALNAVCAVAAAIQLTGDPVWLLLVSGPGAAKTETVGRACRSRGACYLDHYQ
jgi:hypothetical protein